MSARIAGHPRPWAARMSMGVGHWVSDANNKIVAQCFSLDVLQVLAAAPMLFEIAERVGRLPMMTMGEMLQLVEDSRKAVKYARGET